MTYQSLQTLSQIAIAVGLIISAIGGYGAYYYGKKVDDKKVNNERVVNTTYNVAPVHVSKKETNINVPQNHGFIIGEQTNNYTKNTPTLKERPIIDLCHRGISVEQIDEATAYFDIPYCSGKNANAFNVKLQTAIILSIDGRFVVGAPFKEKFPDNITLSYETGKSITYKLSPYTRQMWDITYIYVKGNFTNDEESKYYKVSDLFKYSSHLNAWIRTIGDDDVNVRAFLSQQGLL